MPENNANEVYAGKISTEKKQPPKRTWGVGRPKIRFKDGVYEGEGKGYHGMTRVRVSVEGQKLTAVEILSFEDYTEYFEPAEKSVVSQLLREQSLIVTPLAGATFSSNSIIGAVRQAFDLMQSE